MPFTGPRLVLVLILLGGAGARPQGRDFVDKLLSRFPGSFAGKLLAVRRHVRCANMRFGLMDCSLMAENVTVLDAEPEEAIEPTDDSNRSVALSVDRIDINWTSFTSPVLDLTVSGPNVTVVFSDLLLRSTNWHDLRRAGFPPMFGECRSSLLFSMPSLDRRCFRSMLVALKRVYVLSPGSSNSTLLAPPRLRSLLCTGDLCLRFVSAPLGGVDLMPVLTLSGERLTQVLRQVLGDWNEGGPLEISDFLVALAHALMGMVLEEIQSPEHLQSKLQGGEQAQILMLPSASFRLWKHWVTVWVFALLVGVA